MLDLVVGCEWGVKASGVPRMPSQQHRQETGHDSRNGTEVEYLTTEDRSGKICQECLYNKNTLIETTNNIHSSALPLNLPE